MTTPYQNAGDSVASLRHLMAKHHLTQRDVAGMCCVNLKTVESWLADESSANFRRMPPRHLQCVVYALPGFLGARRSAAKAAKKKGK
jgi:hypothetical protein